MIVTSNVTALLVYYPLAYKFTISYNFQCIHLVQFQNMKAQITLSTVNGIKVLVT